MDGAGPQIIATQTNLVADGTNFDIDPADVGGLARGGLNVFTATAVFDVDGDLQTTSDQVTLTKSETVIRANDAPVTSGEIVLSASEDDANFVLNLLEGASDGDSDSLSISDLTLKSGSDAGVTISGTTLRLSLDAYDNLAVYAAENIVYAYVITDGFGGSTNQSAIITISGANDGPNAVDDAFSGNEENGITGDVLSDNGAGADSDIDGDTLTVSKTPVTDVANGVLVLTGDGSFRYSPDPNFNGTDSFIYTLDDSVGGTDTATVTFKVAAINDASGDVADIIRGQVDTVITGAVLADNASGVDSDMEGDNLTVSETPVSDVANGVLTLNSNCTFSYTPNANFTGEDSFTCRLVDGADLDLDGDSLTVASTLISDVANGNLTLNADGSFLYRTDADFNGADSFEYRVVDGAGGFASAVVDLTIDAVNDAPEVSGPVSAALREDGQPISIALIEGASDRDGGALSIANLKRIAGDDVGVRMDGATFVVDPSAYNGLAAGELETLRYRYDVVDGNGGNTRQSAVIIIRGENDAPVALNDLFRMDEDGSVSANVLADNGLKADSDVDGDALSVRTTPATDVQNGSLTLNTNGAFTYTPDADFNGVDWLVYTLDDGNGGTDTASIRIKVNAVNDAPVAAADTFSGDEDIAITGNLLDDNGEGLDADADGDVVSVSLLPLTAPVNGDLAIAADGTFVYAAAAGFSGDDGFIYALVDGKGGSTTGRVDITVTAKETVLSQAGNNTIAGDGTTRVAYDQGVTGRIFGNLGAGIIRCDSSVGRDSVSGIFEVHGTSYDDILFGTNGNPDTSAKWQLIGVFESYEGMGSNDTIIGRGGLDRANYSQSTAGVTVNLPDGLTSNDGFGW